MTWGPAGFRSQIQILAADPYVRVAGTTMVAAAAIYASPLLTVEQRAAFLPAVSALFTAGAAAACFIGLTGVEDLHERRFWALFGMGLALSAGVQVLLTAVPVGSWGPTRDSLVNAGVLLYYAPLLVGLDRFAAPESSATPRRLARLIRPALFVITASAWATYAILLPLVDPAGSPAPRWDASPVLDIVVAGALIGAQRQSRTPRWNSLQRWLLAAFGLALILHVIDLLTVRSHVIQQVPVLLPFPRMVAHVFVMCAARLRHSLPASAIRVAGHANERARAQSDTTLLVLSAFSLPVAHLLAVNAGLVPLDVLTPQGVVVGLATLLAGSLAAAEYHVIEVERTALAHERDRLARAMLHMQKMEAVGRLGGGIAHDYNNLLTAIGGYADIVMESLPESDPTAQAMKQVRTSVDRASSLTRQLLIVGRRQILNGEAVDVNEAIRDIPYAHRHLLGERTDLRLAPAPGVERAWVDPTQLELVLLNLVVNARDAMPDGGIIRVSTSNALLDDGAAFGWPESKPGRYVRVEVADEGTGIPDDVLPQIFEPFFTTKPAGSGTGLGLAVAYGIVRQSGGRLSVTTAVGKGTTFIVDLPVAASQAPARAPAVREVGPAGSETILVAEDEQAVRELVRSMLTLGGYHVLVAGSGEEALNVSARHDGRIDLLLTDVVMPGMNGRELAARLTARRPDTRVLFMTGYTNDALVRNGVRGGAFTLLPKPFTRQDLSETVRRILDGPGGPKAGGSA